MVSVSVDRSALILLIFASFFRPPDASVAAMAVTVAVCFRFCCLIIGGGVDDAGRSSDPVLSSAASNFTSVAALKRLNGTGTGIGTGTGTGSSSGNGR